MLPDELFEALTSGDDERAEAATRELVILGEAGLPGLQALLTSPDPDARWWTLRVLAEIRLPGVPALLQRGLEDPDSSVRQCALLGVRLQAGPDAIPQLVKLLSDPDSLCASMAADALVVIGPPAVPVLLEVMQSGSPSTRLEAVRALAEISDQRAIPALFAALEDQSAFIEYWASRGLERMGVGMVFLKPE